MLPLADHWQRALALMDTAVTLLPEQRDAWLDDIAAAEPQVAPLLRKLLSAHQRVETNDILATLPRPDRKAQHQSNGEVGAHIGPFELIELLGHGGMGSVWRARYADGRLKRDVAVKLPATSDNPAALASLRERFARERDFLAQLEHPNIARLYDTGVSDAGQPYLAMEYVAGEPIDTYCDQHRLSIKARLTLYLQVLDAVEFAHRQLVLHRDLKPGNVLVDGNGQARLLDFGVAKLLPETSANVSPSASISAGTDLTEMAGAAITLAYAAPEQINNGRLSTATDVYALGVMLYRLLTGNAPYQPKRDTRGALEDEVLTVDPANASSRFASIETLTARQTTEVALRRTLAGDIDTILAKALKKNADERYPTAAALADDLRRHIARLPINARPDSLAYRGSRFVARHRIAVVASVLGVTALLVSSGTALWQAQTATASATRANKEAARASTAQKFLSGMFASADPEQSKTSSAAAQEILARSIAAAERDLAHDPEAHALVLERIADIYRRMGMFEELLATQKRRVAVVESMSSPDVNALIDAQLELGRALGDTNDAKDNAAAMPMLKTAYENTQRRGASAERVAWALSLIADQYRVDQDLVSARDFAEKALSHAERTLASPNRFLAAAYEANAVVASDQRRLDDARKFFAKAIAIDETGHGRGPVDRCLTLNFLAQLEFSDGDYEAALRQSLAIIDLIKNNFGDIKSNLAEAVRTAAFSAARAGNFDAALRLVAEPLDAEVASKHPMRAALAHYSRARIAVQVEDFTRAHAELALAKPVLSTNPIWSSRLQMLLSELSLREDRPMDALNLAETVRQSQTAKYGARHNNMTNTYLWLALAEARAGKTDAARVHMAQSCELLSELRAAHPVRIRCEAYQVLLSSGKSGMEKAAALRDLQTLLSQSSNKKLLLIPALQAAAEQIALVQKGMLPAAVFPILD